MAGQSVGMVTREQPTGEILDELVDQAVAALSARARISRSAEAADPWGAAGADDGNGPPRSRLRPAPPARRDGRGRAAAQERLDTIVRIIAADMVAEVCSGYVMRAGEVLELFATEGLRPEAVHRTRLRVGEGLVGVDRRDGDGRWRWPTRSRIPISPIGRRPARRSITR